MSTSVEDRIRKLAAIVDDLRRGKSFQVTRLTMIKSLCQKPEDAEDFVFRVARLAQQELEGKRGRRARKATPDELGKPVARAMAAMRRHRRSPRPADMEELRACFHELASLQNQYRNIAWGAVRIIESMPALIVEKAVHCMLAPDQGPRWAYEVARAHCERYDPGCWGGLTPASAPRLEEVADFLARHHLGRSLRAFLASRPTRPQPRRKSSRSRRAHAPGPSLDPHSFSAVYPAIAAWVEDGWVEIGRVGSPGAFVRALIESDQVWEGQPAYPSLEAALADLNAGIAGHMKEH